MPFGQSSHCKLAHGKDVILISGIDVFPRSLPVVTDSSLSFCDETGFIPAENFCKG